MKRLTPGKYFACLIACAIPLIAVIFLSPGIGTHSADIGLLDAWRAFFHGDTESMAYRLGFNLRLPRTLLALEVGITLGLCGAVFQALFRNPLATPYTLGISSGGSLGALIAIKWGLAVTIAGVSSISLWAFCGAMFVTGVIFLLTRGARRLTSNELLLAGVTMGLFCSAMMMLVTYLSNARETFAMIRWMMGSLTTIGNFESTSSLPLLVPAWIVLVFQARALNQYLLGEELASSRGVRVLRLQVVCILFVSLATSVVVALCGPIGFVGLVVPQMTALAVGRDCRILLPASALLGGVFLAVCDWISQLAMVWVSAASGRDLGSAVLPIGVVTAVVGVPLFLTLLHRRSS